MRCGHDEPSNENTAYIDNIEFWQEEYSVVLGSDGRSALKIGDKISNGNWTMVYDEGFNIDTEDWTFFAFSKYIPTVKTSLKPTYKSKCYQTCTGWYASSDNSLWGCYVATKINVNENTIFQLNDYNQVQILQPIESKEPKKNLKKPILDNQQIEIRNISVSNLLLGNFEVPSFLEMKNQLEYKSTLDSLLFSSSNMKSFLKLSSSFSNHYLYLERLKHINKNWIADVTQEFRYKTISELNRFAGFPRARKDSSFNSFRFKEKEIVDDDLNFPKNFDWKDHLREAGSQGNCGSCYAYSSTRMAEARLSIKYSHKQRLSVQHSLDCAFYNQGCSGGYPYLLMKFATQFEMIPEDCKPYIEMNGSCDDSCDIESLDLIYRLKNYRYVGGSYGMCSERKMMEELYNNGPIVVSFEPDYNFMLYKSGIYHTLAEDSWIKAHVQKPEWQKVDHSVLLVGWGEEKGEKFWIIQNTWGPLWGENGFFRMKRGVDELGIESICEAADPIVINNKSNTEMTKKELELMTNKDGKSDLGQSIFSFLTPK